MKFPAGLPADEKFVIESMDKEFAGTWGWGARGKCPDAYLTFNAKTIAVEITTLTQYVTDDLGTRPRASDDASIDRLVDCLNAKLHDLIPARYSIGLVLSTPILKLRKTTANLAECLRNRLLDIPSFERDREIEIHSNVVKISLHSHEEIRSQKVWAMAANRHSNANILLNAIQILEDRISAKAKNVLR